MRNIKNKSTSISLITYKSTHFKETEKRHTSSPPSFFFDVSTAGLRRHEPYITPSMKQLQVVAERYRVGVGWNRAREKEIKTRLILQLGGTTCSPSPGVEFTSGHFYNGWARAISHLEKIQCCDVFKCSIEEQ